MRPDKELGLVPYGDQYYLTRVGFKKTLEDTPFHPEPGFLGRALHGVTGNTRPEFVCAGLFLDDADGYARTGSRALQLRLPGPRIPWRPALHRDRRDPQARTRGEGRFLGRVWVEDRDFNIVRFNGTFAAGQARTISALRHLAAEHAARHLAARLRLQRRPGHAGHAKFRGGSYKAETRIWGYNVGKGHAENEFTEVLVDDASAVKDNSDKAQDLAPVAAERAWQRQAEDNVVERLERGGLLARTGEVDKVLNTVINNLEITNNLDIQPEVRCRVLLTSPLESFSMGHTIFVSRGMLDVLPDEASLAAVLAHELAHIVLGHPTDTTFAFKDRSTVSDQQLLRRMHFTRTQEQEKEADAKALMLLENSPYKDKLEQLASSCARWMPAAAPCRT